KTALVRTLFSRCPDRPINQPTTTTTTDDTADFEPFRRGLRSNNRRLVSVRFFVCSFFFSFFCFSSPSFSTKRTKKNRKQVTVDDIDVVLEILDTAGQDDFSMLRDQWIRECDGFVLVYNITDRDSFDELGKDAFFFSPSLVARTRTPFFFF